MPVLFWFHGSGQFPFVRLCWLLSSAVADKYRFTLHDFFSAQKIIIQSQTHKQQRPGGNGGNCGRRGSAATRKSWAELAVENGFTFICGARNC